MSKRSKRTGQWLKSHQQDEFVRRAQRDGWRSRAVYKLSELQERHSLIRPGMTIVDLGAAPGGWSQYASSLLNGIGRVIAVDILPVEPLDGVLIMQGDFSQNSVLERILRELNGRSVDLVMSDLAPNISGMKAVDQPRAMYLAELVLDFARQQLKVGGVMVTKVFQGEGFDAFVKEARSSFEHVGVRKPTASRPRSREVYLLARNYRM